MKSSLEQGKATKNRQSTAVGKSVRTPSHEDQTSRIAVAAYYKAEARGFEPGYMLEDWVAAEQELQ